MSKAKLFLMTALATMAFAASAFAAVPSGYDSWVNVEKVKNWRVSNYSQNLPMSVTSVNVPKVTALEARTDGYVHDYITNGAKTDEGLEVYACPNLPGPEITEEMLEELFKGNN